MYNSASIVVPQLSSAPPDAKPLRSSEGEISTPSSFIVRDRGIEPGVSQPMFA